MKIHLHKNAKTTPAQRAFIKTSFHLNISELARKLGVSPTTVRKWKKRNSLYDRPHIPHKISSALTLVQETLVVLLRLSLRSGLDDLHGIVSRFICPEYARSSLNRCLKRYQISRLEPLSAHLQADIHDYRGIFLYYTVIHLPVLFETENNKFIHIFLDCSTRWVHVEITPDTYLNDPCHFIETIIMHFPAKILGIIAGELIDLSGTDIGNSIAHENHRLFIQTLCKTRQPLPLATDHCHSITRRRVGKNWISKSLPDVLKSMGSSGELKNRVLEYLSDYNTRLCQRTLKQKTPGEAMRNRYTLFPGSFRSRPE